MYFFFSKCMSPRAKKKSIKGITRRKKIQRNKAKMKQYLGRKLKNLNKYIKNNNK